MPKFFLRHRTETNIQGPIEAGAVVEMAGSGKIHPEDMLQVAGRADAPWREAWRYRELFPPEVSARYEAAGCATLVRTDQASPVKASAQAGGSTGIAGGIFAICLLVAVIAGGIWLAGWYWPEWGVDTTAAKWITIVAGAIGGFAFAIAEQKAKNVFVGGFDAITVGMTIEQVEQLLSEPAKELTRDAMPDPANVGQFIEMVTYQWQGLDGSMLTVVAVNDRVFSKNIVNINSLLGIPTLTAPAPNRRR